MLEKYGCGNPMGHGGLRAAIADYVSIFLVYYCMLVGVHKKINYAFYILKSCRQVSVSRNVFFILYDSERPVHIILITCEKLYR